MVYIYNAFHEGKLAIKSGMFTSVLSQVMKLGKMGDYG